MNYWRILSGATWKMARLSLDLYWIHISSGPRSFGTQRVKTLVFWSLLWITAGRHSSEVIRHSVNMSWIVRGLLCGDSDGGPGSLSSPLRDMLEEGAPFLSNTGSWSRLCSWVETGKGQNKLWEHRRRGGDPVLLSPDEQQLSQVFLPELQTSTSRTYFSSKH